MARRSGHVIRYHVIHNMDGSKNYVIIYKAIRPQSHKATKAFMQ